MTKIDLKEQALKLPPEERMELAAELWESSFDKVASPTPPDWHWPLVEKALEEHRRDPESAIDGKEVLARLKRPRA
jgi:hypothetical protein